MSMILTLRKKSKVLLIALLTVVVFSPPLHFVAAQEALTLSISPSLFNMTANPGQEWRSTLRIINVNPYDLTVYLDIVNFSPQGEGGNGTFIPIEAGDKDGSTLAEWFTVEKTPVTIPQEQSIEIPFAVRVPEGAAPGGHFAAILVGTKPLNPETGQARVQTSQMVTSLFFARVSGDVVELGSIREFTTTEAYLNRPEATFELRFENKGNVHLQPQGDIKITNMWGQERGIVPINQNSHFGNVLPDSIRKFTFSWKGEWSISDIGRYTAVATLAYGTDDRQFSSSKTSFWVIPFKLLFGILLGLLLFGILVTWLVRLYVRHMLQMAGINISEYKDGTSISLKNHARAQKVSIHKPLQVGIETLQMQLQGAADVRSKISILGTFIVRYKLFFIAVGIGLSFVTLLISYVLSANTSQRDYEVAYVNSDATVTLSSEEIIYHQMREERGVAEVPVNPGLPKLQIINRSGVPGAGAEARLRLEAFGYKVLKTESDFDSEQARTVIVYKIEDEKDALRLSSRLDNALVSVSEDKEQETDVITVFVGGDIMSK